MKGNFWKQGLCILLALALLLPLLPQLPTTVSAAEPVTVEIVSFMRQESTDLRVSELLEARVTGYEGNTAQLTYKWTNNLGKDGGWFGWGAAGTYLYVFSTHNMYTAQGTEAEQEIYNSSRGVSASANMSGRASNKTFTGTGYAYAAIYGANVSASDYNQGSITVEVYDGSTLIGTATHSGFVSASLEADLHDAVFGLFVGETISVKDLLGESAIVHVPCVASNVSYAKITDGDEFISLSGTTTDYHITGLSKGVTEIEITLEKENCKFHQYTSGSATPRVHVFKKPTVTPGLTTLTLTEVDPDCTYYLGGAQGVKQPNGTILFEGLDPSTTYEIEVRGHYQDNDGNDKTVYTFVYGTTLTPNVASVVLRLDSIMVPADQVGLNTVYLQTTDGSKTIALTYDAEGKHYIGQASNGTYGVYNRDAEGNVTQLGNGQHLVISNTNATTTLNYYTLTCDPNGGTYAGATDPTVTVHYIGETITAPAAPSYPGNRFLGWQYEGNTYQPGQTVNMSIEDPMVLTALWEDAIDVYVNIKLHHFDHDTYRHNNDNARYNVSFTVDARPADSTGDYTEIASHAIRWDGASGTVSGYDAKNEVGEHKDLTTYTATAPTFTDLQKGLSYTVTAAKSGYEVFSVTQETAENGDVYLTAELMYAPDDYDFTFSVELDEEARQLPDEDKPHAVNVKVTAWHDTPYDNEDRVYWSAVRQHNSTYYRVNLDENGQGNGSFPVAMTTSDGTLPYHYRIEVVSYELPDGTVMPAINRDDTTYITDCGHYEANVYVEGGKVPSGSTLSGAYYNDATTAQQGAVTAIVSIHTHKLTLLTAGGSFTDGTTTKVIDKILNVPSVAEYVPQKAGGYVFNGWYVDENGNGSLEDEETTQLVPGEEMLTDLTAIARYHAPLTIQGDITAQYFYYLEGEKTYMYDHARLTETTVILRRRLAGAETYSTYAEQVIPLDNTQQDSATSPYIFTEIPAYSEHGVAYEYIMAVRQSNYTATYTPSYSYDTGLGEHRQAAKPAFTGNVGTADAVLSFTPESTVIPFRVDTSLIKDPAARPVSVDVVYLTTVADNTFLQWDVITQHLDGNSLNGTFDETGIATSAEGEYPVWNTTPNGKYEYLYQLHIVSYTMPDGTKVAMEDNKLFNVYYGNHVSFNSEDKTLTARLSPLPFNLTLDTNQTEVTLQAEAYTDMGASQQTAGECFAHTYYYGDGVAALPTPNKAGWAFLGWYDAPTGGNQVTSVSATTGENIYLYAQWEEHFTVNFHANLPIANQEIFRTYYPSGTTLPEGSRYFHLEEDGSLPGAFYDLPKLSYTENNDYIFLGWYLDQTSTDRPLDFANAVFTDETDVYAHWIHVGQVAQHETDTKLLTDSAYREYDLAGVQIRPEAADEDDHLDGNGNVVSGTQKNQYSGLRFVAVLSENVYSRLDTVSATDVEYGFVIALTDTAQYYCEKRGLTDLQYRGSNVNGVNTTADYNFVQNMRCSGVADHFNCEDYRLYTAVVTYKNKTGQALLDAQANPILARAYLRYTDANGLLRTYYNNYTGTNTYHGCSTSYTQVWNMLNPDSN